MGDLGIDEMVILNASLINGEVDSAGLVDNVGRYFCGLCPPSRVITDKINKSYDIKYE